MKLEILIPQEMPYSSHYSGKIEVKNASLGRYGQNSGEFLKLHKLLTSNSLSYVTQTSEMQYIGNGLSFKYENSTC